MGRCVEEGNIRKKMVERRSGMRRGGGGSKEVGRSRGVKDSIWF